MKLLVCPKKDFIVSRLNIYRERLSILISQKLMIM